MSRALIVFDVETNGLAPDRFSVLSFSALLVHTWRSNGYRHFQVKQEFDRYYFPKEPYNRQAIRVNGLTANVLEQKRKRTGGDYPLHFVEDPEVTAFCQGALLAVCHNVPFDAAFLKQAHGFEFPRSICTMRTFTEYCAIPHPYYGVKWPKLEEAVEIICGRDDFAFHDSLADCYAVLEILKVMGNSGESSEQHTWRDLFDQILY